MIERRDPTNGFDEQILWFASTWANTGMDEERTMCHSRFECPSGDRILEVRMCSYSEPVEASPWMIVSRKVEPDLDLSVGILLGMYPRKKVLGVMDRILDPENVRKVLTRERIPGQAAPSISSEEEFQIGYESALFLEDLGKCLPEILEEPRVIGFRDDWIMRARPKIIDHLRRQIAFVESVQP